MSMRAQAQSCNSCLYWQDYPTWEGFGVCDNPVSHSYSRGVVGEATACSDFATKVETPNPKPGDPRRPVLSGLPEAGRSRSPPSCSDCHFWAPVDYMTTLGECTNPNAKYLQRPVWADKPAEGCFAERSFEGLQLLWCQACHQTISTSDIPNHASCKLYVSAAQLSVEEMMEVTLAGD